MTALDSEPGAATSVDAEREELARRQKDLLAALVAGGPVPEGFDTERIRIQSVALAAKRREGVLRSVPQLAEGLGEGWPGAYMDWARTHAKPAEGGSRADAAAFVAYLRGQGDLPQALEDALSAAAPQPSRRPGLAARLRARFRRRDRKTGWDDPDDEYCSG